MSGVALNDTISEVGQSHGWVSSPSGRGTANILSSCLATIFLCCWTAVCPNIPALSDSRWDQLHDKVTLAMIALLGPEFLLGIAAGQFTSAVQSVKASAFYTCESKNANFCVGIQRAQHSRLEPRACLLCRHGRVPPRDQPERPGTGCDISS
jgi:hypothetical protein